MQINWKTCYFTRSAKFILFAIFTACSIIYFSCDIYDFRSPEKFSGDFLFNPYKDVSPDWQKANFHAHSVAWNGVTNGKQDVADIIKLYQQKQYAYACVSNYESIAKEDARPNAVNVYEHGYNIFKTHQLVIMPQQVCYSDFPLFEFASSKQFIINKLNTEAKAVALPHPVVRNGYSDDDLKKISGYNLIEVLNHSCNSAHKWDVALSAGKPVWIVGDDDTHDVLDKSQTFTNWTMIDCHQHDKDSLINNLINGNAYAVNGNNSFNDNELLYESINDMDITIAFERAADSIKLIGQNGLEKRIVFDTDKINYRFTAEDSYIRAVVYSKSSVIYLNPTIRYSGVVMPQNKSTAVINTHETLLYRSVLIAAWLAVFILYFFPNTISYKPVSINLGYKKRAWIN